MANAAVCYTFEGDARMLDGTAGKVVDKTADIDKVKNLKAGTILVKFRHVSPATIPTDERFAPVVIFSNAGWREVQSLHYSLGNEKNMAYLGMQFCAGKGISTRTHADMPYEGWHTGALTSGNGTMASTLDGKTGTEKLSGAAAGFFRCLGSHTL